MEGVLLVGFRFIDPFGVVARRERRRAEFEQHVRFARQHKLHIVRLDKIYQKARKGEKGLGSHFDRGRCDIWFSQVWPAPKRVYIVEGFWREPATEAVYWHHHNVSFFHVKQIVGEFPVKVWDAAMRG